MKLPRRFETWDGEEKEGGWCIDREDLIKWAKSVLQSENLEEIKLELQTLIDYLN